MSTSAAFRRRPAAEARDRRAAYRRRPQSIRRRYASSDTPNASTDEEQSVSGPRRSVRVCEDWPAWRESNVRKPLGDVEGVWVQHQRQLRGLATAGRGAWLAHAHHGPDRLHHLAIELGALFVVEDQRGVHDSARVEPGTSVNRPFLGRPRTIVANGRRPG